MSSVARTLLVLTIPAAAIGALAGLALRAAETTPPDAPPVPLAPQEDRSRPRRDAAGGRPDRDRRARDRAGTTRIVVGNESDDVVPLDAKFAERLSAADEDTRLACALELLRMGPSAAPRVDRLPTSTAAGSHLRDGIVNALTSLGRIAAGEDYAQLSPDARTGLELKYWGTVVPPRMLVQERARYWSDVVVGDAERLAIGGITAGEAAWHELELGAVRRQSGRIGDDAWTKLRAEKIDIFAAWVAELEAAGPAATARLREAKAALARLR